MPENSNWNHGNNAGRRQESFANQRQNTRAPGRNWEADFKPEWVTKGLDEQALTYLNEFGKELKNTGLTTSQFRNVYGELKRIQLKELKNERASFMMLRPKLAYAQGRHGKPDKSGGIDKFKAVFDKGIKEVKWNEGNETELAEATFKFRNFMNCMEALLAYHRANGGK